jgi:hypothetical protein
MSIRRAQNMLTEDDHMIKIINWDGQRITMEVCEACGIGSGVTRYPDMAYQHAQATLREGLCDDCFRSRAKAHSPHADGCHGTRVR